MTDISRLSHYKHGHNRGPVNGMNGYRCLNCGKISEWMGAAP